jgi:hypothetical protein
VRLVKASPGKGKANNPVMLQVRINNASGASQADGPPLSDLEMSFAGRSFPTLGRKMLRPDLAPLSLQKVAADDSVLGPFSRQRNAPRHAAGQERRPRPLPATVRLDASRRHGVVHS